MPDWMGRNLGKSAFSVGFSLSKLSLQSYSNGFNLWHFMGLGDVMEDILAPGFFDEARGLVSLIDHIHISAADRTGIASFHIVDGGLTAILMASSPRLPADLEARQMARRQSL